MSFSEAIIKIVGMLQDFLRTLDGKRRDGKGSCMTSQQTKERPKDRRKVLVSDPKINGHIVFISHMIMLETYVVVRIPVFGVSFNSWRECCDNSDNGIACNEDSENLD